MNKPTKTMSKLLPLLNPLGSFCLRGGDNAKLSILIYHRIMTEHDPFRPGEPTAQMFDQQMQILSRHFNVFPLTEAIDRLYKGSLPPRSACITFDDGYTDNLTIGVDILKRHSLTATFFLTSGFLESGIMWNDIIIESMRNTKKDNLNLGVIGLDSYILTNTEDRCKAANHIINSLKYLPFHERLDQINQIVELSQPELPDNLMMNAEQIKQLYDSGMEVGGHTVSHPILKRIDLKTAQDEIMKNKDHIEGIIKDKLSVFAYPNGRPNQDYSDEHVKLLKQLGFTSAVSTAWGTGNASCDRFQLPRFTPWDRTPARFMLRLYQNAFNKLPEQILNS